jgi:dihydroxyacetone kinase-like predicted kinase
MNDELALDVTIEALGKYAKNCEKDPIAEVMNPIEGTYLMTNSLAVALLWKADENLDDCRQLMHEAIDDAFKKVSNTNKKERKNE